MQTATGLGNSDPRDMASRIVYVILGFLGIIALLIIIFGVVGMAGAGGNEDKTAKAKTMMIAGFIGLVVILASFAIAQFVISALYNASGANG